MFGLKLLPRLPKMVPQGAQNGQKWLPGDPKLLQDERRIAQNLLPPVLPVRGLPLRYNTLGIPPSLATNIISQRLLFVILGYPLST